MHFKIYFSFHGVCHVLCRASRASVAFPASNEICISKSLVESTLQDPDHALRRVVVRRLAPASRVVEVQLPPEVQVEVVWGVAPIC
jgi:hypothetical protein